MRRSIAPLIERAILVAMAPACGTSMIQPDGGSGDATVDQTADASDANTDVTDGGFIGDSSVHDVGSLPLPDGCVVSDKPDHFAPCGYSEVLSDPISCEIDLDAEAGKQDASLCFVLCAPGEPDCIYYDLGGDSGYLLSCGAGCVGRLHEMSHAESDCCEPLTETVGGFLSRAAMLEAASVAAFRVLTRELRSHGAPRRLVRAAERAARDEMRHARVVGSLARRHGGYVGRAVPTKARRRPLLDIALENAVEGCVRETWGAALASWQAKHAEDARVRMAMVTIAKDEARHADLGWQIDAWLVTRLDASSQARVRRARERAIRDLSLTLARSPGSVGGALGLPAPVRARAMFNFLRESLWAHAG